MILEAEDGTRTAGRVVGRKFVPLEDHAGSDYDKAICLPQG